MEIKLTSVERKEYWECCWNESSQEWYPTYMKKNKLHCKGCNHKIVVIEEEPYKKEMKKILEKYENGN